MLDPTSSCMSCKQGFSLGFQDAHTDHTRSLSSRTRPHFDAEGGIIIDNRDGLRSAVRVPTKLWIGPWPLSA